jgi:hypothetical protein
MTRFKFPEKFLAGVHGRIDVSSELLLRGTRHPDDFGKRHVADDEQVDVACRPELCARGRAEDERDLDRIDNRRESLADELHDSERLDHEVPQLGEDRGGTIRLEVDLSPAHGPLQHRRSRQQLKLALYRARGSVSPAKDLADVICLVRMAQQQAEHPLARLAEQDVSGAKELRTHYGYLCTHSGYNASFSTSRPANAWLITSGGNANTNASYVAAGGYVPARRPRRRR